MGFSETRTEHVFYFIQSWNDMNRYISGCRWDLKTLQDQTNQRHILKNRFLGGQVMHSSGHLFLRKHHCPGIALREHEAKLHLPTLRATSSERSRILVSTLERKLYKLLVVFGAGAHSPRAPVPQEGRLLRFFSERAWNKRLLLVPRNTYWESPRHPHGWHDGIKQNELTKGCQTFWFSTPAVRFFWRTMFNKKQLPKHEQA